VIQIVPPADPQPLAAAVAAAGSYDWLVFTSANAVDCVFRALDEQALDARTLGAAKVAVIGPKTGAALRRYGVRADLVADQYVGEALAQKLIDQGPFRRVLLARAAGAREALPKALRDAGARVDVVAAYETHPVTGEQADELRSCFEQGKVDVAMFTSSSTVTSLVEALGERAGELLSGVVTASIGPITSGTLREQGLRIDVEATEFTVEGLLDALARHFGPTASPV
jgi:uroporphyrinogen III methyltransferase/synthase